MTSGTAISASSAAATASRGPSPSGMPEQSLGPQEQHENHGEEADRILPARRKIARAERLRETQQQPADDRSDEAPHATEDHDNERLQRDDAAHRRFDRDEAPEHRPRRGSQRGAE